MQKKSRYAKSEIDSIISDMYDELGISALDEFELCKRLKVKLKPYSELPAQSKEYVKIMDINSFNVFDKKKKVYTIYYNDFQVPLDITYSILKEIGHITLAHKAGSVSEMIEDEEDALYFAKRALRFLKKEAC